jgi:hypothetical protein
VKYQSFHNIEYIYTMLKTRKPLGLCLPESPLKLINPTDSLHQWKWIWNLVKSADLLSRFRFTLTLEEGLHIFPATMEEIRSHHFHQNPAYHQTIWITEYKTPRSLLITASNMDSHNSKTQHTCSAFFPFFFFLQSLFDLYNCAMLLAQVTEHCKKQQGLCQKWVLLLPWPSIDKMPIYFKYITFPFWKLNVVHWTGIKEPSKFAFCWCFT